MRVLFDASAVAEGLVHPQRRRGIFRVVAELLDALASRSDIELSLSAARSWGAVAELGRYQRTRPALRTASIISAHRHAVARSLAQVQSEMFHKAPPALRTALAKTSALQARTLDRLMPSLTDADIGGHDLFHLPAHWIPRLAEDGRTRRVITIYDIIADTHPEFGNRWARAAFQELRRSIGDRDFVVTDSDWVRNEVADHWGIPHERIRAAPLAASPDVFHPEHDAMRIEFVRRAHGIPDGPYLLGANRPERRKNVPHLIRAFVRMTLQSRLPGVTLVLVGGHRWDPSELFEMPEERAVSRERVILTRDVTDAELAPLYSGARAFVFPSLLEGFGLPALEAMQCGTPVIASNRSSLPEVVGDAAVLVDPADLDALSGAMLDILQSDARRDELAALALARSRLFSWDATANRVVEAYREACRL